MYRSIALIKMNTEMKKEELMHETENDLKQEIMNEVHNPENERKMRQESGKFEVEIDLNGECRMAAFARGLNRGVNEKSVALLTERMVAKGYRKAEQVQVIKAEEALGQNPHLELVDMGGEPIKAEEAALYYLVPDG